MNRMIGLAIGALGVMAIASGGPWQECEFETDYSEYSVCDELTPDCGHCYRYRWRDYYCGASLTLWCHLQLNVTITRIKEKYGCSLAMPDTCRCAISDYVGETEELWSGGEDCYNTDL